MEALGINFIQIIAYTIIFFILYMVARKFVAKVLKTVEERQSQIEAGLDNAEQAEKIKSVKTSEAEAEKEKIIQQAYKHAEEIVEKAKSKEEEIVSQAKEKAKAVIEENKSELEALREKSKETGLKDAKEIIALAVKKTFEGLEIDSKTEAKLIEDSLKNIK